MMEEFSNQLRNLPQMSTQGAVPVGVLPLQPKAPGRSLVTQRASEALIANEDFEPTVQVPESPVIDLVGDESSL